jgi:quinol monooxygenase YgiN
MEESMIYVVAKNFIQADKVETVRSLASELITETRKEDGCISYNLVQDREEPGILTFIEEWESKDHLDAHMKTAHFVKIFPELLKCTLKEGEVNIYNQF